MRISNVQANVFNTTRLKTGAQKQVSTPVNNMTGDTVSFNGRGSRATSIVFSFLTALAALTSVATAKAANTEKEAATVPTPAVTIDVPPYSPAQSIAPPPITFTVQERLNISRYNMERTAKEAAEAEESAVSAEKHADELEAVARQAELVSNAYDKMKPVWNIADDGSEIAKGMEKYLKMTDTSVPDFEDYVAKIEEAVENGELSADEAAEAKILTSEARNGLADVKVAIEEADGAMQSVKESATETSELASNVFGAAKDGVWIPNTENIEKSIAKTTEATSDAKDKFNTLQTTYDDLYESMKKLGSIAEKLGLPPVQKGQIEMGPNVIYDTYEMIYGKSLYQMEAESANTKAAMARAAANSRRADADKLAAEADKATKLYEALKTIDDAETAAIEAQDARKLADKLAAEALDARKIAEQADVCKPTRIAGRKVLNEDVYASKDAAYYLDTEIKKANILLDYAKEAGLSEKETAFLVKLVEKAGTLSDETKSASDATEDAARAALASKNRNEANAAKAKLDSAVAKNDKATEKADKTRQELAEACDKIIILIKAAPNVEDIEIVLPGPVRLQTPPIACGPEEVFGKTQERLDANRMQSEADKAKKEAETKEKEARLLAKEAKAAKEYLENN